ncbi:MAG: efflux RND transporter periplasmic adaptor subunit [Candidatus Omnitrophica bacterium]|jgi:Cu(I)/Ag(I) efflux system membrane fusion protein|nr:efflux RND transporter periplasmic adaptor subunit [Candidatus Omnitrophota bacterium]
MKNKKIIIVLLIIALLIGAYNLLRPVFIKSKKEPSLKKTQDESPAIEYWTCSMHPQVKKDGPGKCPICAMELIPVYKQDKDKIAIDEMTRDKLGLKSQTVSYRSLIKTLRIPGRVSHDYELYVLEQEYLSVLSGLDELETTVNQEVIDRQKALLDSARLKLRLLGFNEEKIKELEKTKKPDESLIYPTGKKVWIHADIYEQDLSIIKPTQKVDAKIKGYEEEIFTGEIYTIEEVLNPQTRSAKARVIIADPKNLLKHEVYAELIVEIDLGKRLAAPKTSIIDTGTRKVAYLDLGQGRYQLVQVKTGIEAQDYVEILEGLKENDLVVTDGNFFLDSQTTLAGGQELLYGAGEEIKEKAKEPQHIH